MSSLFRSIVSAPRATAVIGASKRYRYGIAYPGPKPASYDSAWKDVPQNPSGDYSEYTKPKTTPLVVPEGTDPQAAAAAEEERVKKIETAPMVVDVEKKFTPFTRRAGILARKRGMTCLWDEDGKRWPVTILQVSREGVWASCDDTHFAAGLTRSPF